MAGLKKPTRKRDASNPNTVLVIFLVFFVLLSIGLGIWGYYGYAGQEKLRVSTSEEIKKAQASKEGREFGELKAYDAWLAINGTLGADERTSWSTWLPDALSGTGKFSKETGLPAFKKVRDENIGLLLGADANTGYKTNYKALIAKLQQETRDAQASMTKAKEESVAAKKGLDDLQLKTEDYWRKAMEQIKKDGQKTLERAREMSASMKEQIEKNDELQKQLSTIRDTYDAKMQTLEGKIRILQTNNSKLDADLKDARSSLIVTRGGGDPHALMLDISAGRALWDQPRGKILRVDFDNRQVVINIGANAGVKPEMTFNVFGSSWKGYAEGTLKGTVEVIRVLDGSTSLARITSLYDVSGAEIAINDAAIGRIQREASNLMKKDDLLFNLTLGARVFIAGGVHWHGQASATPAGQMRNLRDFISILENQGVKVDGYIDLADGKIVGGITLQTRFVIRGDAPTIERKVPKKDDEEKAEAPGGGREKSVNDAMAAVRAEAVEKGLFIISADNLANVIGYRRPHSASDLEVSSFRPGLPAATKLGK
jgi:hypothetical protein